MIKYQILNSKYYNKVLLIKFLPYKCFLLKKKKLLDNRQCFSKYKLYKTKRHISNNYWL